MKWRTKRSTPFLPICKFFWFIRMRKESTAPVFFSGGNAAANVSLRLIDIQHFFGLKGKTAVEQGQALRNVFVNCRFTDAKLLCSGADGGPVLYDVKSQTLGPVLHIPFQTIHSPPCGGSVYAASVRGMPCDLPGEWIGRRQFCELGNEKGC